MNQVKYIYLGNCISCGCRTPDERSYFITRARLAFTQLDYLSHWCVFFLSTESRVYTAALRMDFFMWPRSMAIECIVLYLDFHAQQALQSKGSFRHDFRMHRTEKPGRKIFANLRETVPRVSRDLLPIGKNLGLLRNSQVHINSFALSNGMTVECTLVWERLLERSWYRGWEVCK